jgi:hypothetical protein
MEQDQKAVEQEAQAPVAEQQQEDKGKESPNTGDLIAESKKYRTRAQESESLVQDLQNQLKAIEDNQLAEKEDYKTLAEKREKENAELKAKADIGEALEKSLRADALESIPDEDREFAEDMSTDKLLKFSKRYNLQNVRTDESVAKSSATGGYSSALEWVTNDPVGYAKAKQGTGLKSKFGNIFNPSGDS